MASVLRWRRIPHLGVALAMGLSLAMVPSVARTIDWSTLSSANNGLSTGLSAARLNVFTSVDSAYDSERMRTIEEGLDLWRDNPVIGAGLGAYVEQTSAQGYQLVIHSTPIWLLAETGLLGLFVFLLAAVLVFWPAWRGTCARDPAATALFLFLIAFGAMAMVHELAFQRIVWFFLGASLALSGHIPTVPAKPSPSS